MYIYIYHMLYRLRSQGS